MIETFFYICRIINKKTMCLEITENSRFRTVKKERTVYKMVGYTVVRKSNTKRKFTFCSPFIEEHKIIVNKLEIFEGTLQKSLRSVITGFHTLKNVEDAKNEVIENKWFFKGTQSFDGVRIIECKIPVGAKIIKGKFGKIDSYVSDQIFYGKTVYTFVFNK